MNKNKSKNSKKPVEDNQYGGMNMQLILAAFFLQPVGIIASGSKKVGDKIVPLTPDAQRELGWINSDKFEELSSFVTSELKNSCNVSFDVGKGSIMARLSKMLDGPKSRAKPLNIKKETFSEFV